jgi:hypothetical protein
MIESSMKRSLPVLLAGVALAATAADGAALQRCSDLRDPAARLACYDAIPLAATAATPSPAIPATVVPSPAVTFGLESRPATSVALAPLPSIDSTIDGTFDGWLPRGQLKLANGQIWEVADGSTAAYRLQSPKVKITRGVSGTFFMAIDGVSQTPRVRRLK